MQHTSKIIGTFIQHKPVILKKQKSKVRFLYLLKDT